MRIIYGEIEPGIRIGKYLLGSTKEEILPRLPAQGAPLYRPAAPARGR